MAGKCEIKLLKRLTHGQVKLYHIRALATLFRIQIQHMAMPISLLKYPFVKYKAQLPSVSLYSHQYLEDADLEILKPLNVFFNRKNVSIVHAVVQFFQKNFRQPKKRMFPEVVLSMLPFEFTRVCFGATDCCTKHFRCKSVSWAVFLK